MPLDPCRLFIHSAQAELACPHPPDLLGGDEPRLLQDADVLLHAGQGHMEVVGKGRDRRVRTPDLLKDPASGGVRERGERGIESAARILNHLVQCAPSCAGSQAPEDSGPVSSATSVGTRCKRALLSAIRLAGSRLGSTLQGVTGMLE